MRLSEEELLDIESLLKECSPGPWYPSVSSSGKELVICRQFLYDVIASNHSSEYFSEEQINNFWLMGESRELIPKLIKEIRDLQEELLHVKLDFENYV